MGAEAKVNLFIIGAAKCGTTSLFKGNFRMFCIFSNWIPTLAPLISVSVMPMPTTALAS